MARVGDKSTCKKCGESIEAHASDAAGKNIFWTHSTRKTHDGKPTPE